uniref:Uncharacterized protein n=1 Tax=viral metagenome TaxID=1070528 RepID=A0A6C0HWH9_9ZZZZ
MIVSLLIIFFIILISYQLILAIWGNNVLEGLENATTTTTTTPPVQTYQEYNTNDPNNPNSALILAQQNAGNIEYLKQRVNDLMGMKQQVTDISLNVVALNDQVAGLVQQQATYAQSIAGSQPANISGIQSAESEYTTA